MIDKQLLKKIFKYNIISNSNLECIELQKNNYVIIILDNFSYEKHRKFLIKYFSKRKNCWFLRSNFLNKTYIYFKEDFIKSIIRQKTINTLLND